MVESRMGSLIIAAGKAKRASSPRLTAMPRERLRGWPCRTRTRKCRFFVISGELLGFTEHFRIRDLFADAEKGPMQIALSQSDICEFESYMPSHAVRSLWGGSRPCNMRAGPCV